MEQWNQAHNAHDVNDLASLYAPEVLFYGTELTKAACVEKKRRAFAATPDYTQSIRDATFEAGTNDRTFVRLVKTSTTQRSPRAFLHFLWHYIMTQNPSKYPTEEIAKEGSGAGILGSDPNGALQYTPKLEAALAFLFTYHPLAYDAQGNYLGSPGFGLSFADPVIAPSGSWPQGTVIQAISDSIIQQHQPVLIGVGPKKCWHQVLVVGVAKDGDKTFYIAIDSGFSGDFHPGALLSATVPLSWPKVVQYTISDKGGLEAADGSEYLLVPSSQR